MAELTNNVYEGSVYRVTRVRDGFVTLTDKGTISAYDGERYEEIPGLAEVRTAQTVCAMEFMARHNLPLSYVRQESPTTILCLETSLFPLEVVARRATIGSYLKRNPRALPAWVPDGRIIVEYFHKQTYDVKKRRLVDGSELRKLGKDEVKRLKAEKLMFPDPYLRATEDGWKLFDATEPQSAAKPLATIPPVLSPEEHGKVSSTAAYATQLLSYAFGKVQCEDIGVPDCTSLALADIKFELGRTQWMDLLIADVVNLDSLRLIINGEVGPGMRHLSKQVFRDGGSADEVLEVYKQGLRVFEQFRHITAPRQTVIGLPGK